MNVRRLGGIVAALVALVLVLYVTRGDHGGDGEERSVGLLPTAPAPNSGDGSLDAVGVTVDPAKARSTTPEDPRLDDSPREAVVEQESVIAGLRTAMADLRGRPDAAHFEFKSLLLEVARVGGDEAAALLCEWMLDEDLEFAHRARAFSDAANIIQDASLAASALLVLDRNWESGSVSAYDVGGYVEVMARHGGASEAARVLEAVGTGPPTLSGIAAEQVGFLAGKVEVREVVGVVLVRGDLAGPVFGGLANWDDPRARQEIDAYARDPDYPTRARAGALGALMDSDPRSGLESAAAVYWESEDDGGRIATIQALSATSQTFDDRSSTGSVDVEEVLLDALGSGRSSLIEETVWMLGNKGSLLRPRVRTELSQVLGSESTSEELRAAIQQLLSAR